MALTQLDTVLGIKGAQANDVMADGTLWVGKDYAISKSVDNGVSFQTVFTIPTQANRWDYRSGVVKCVFIDSAGSIFVSAMDTNRLYRSTDGVDFVEVLNLGYGSVYQHDSLIVEMTEGPTGTLYAAEYGYHARSGGGTRARLWKSTTGGGLGSWSVIRSWGARHMHYVNYNPYNGWVYAVVGEDNLAGTYAGLGGHSVWRSKDGTNFIQIQCYAANFYDWPILFLGSDCYLGRDYPREPRILKFTDDGSNGPFTPVQVYASPNSVNGVIRAGTRLGDWLIFSAYYDNRLIQTEGITWEEYYVQTVIDPWPLNHLLHNPTKHPERVGSCWCFIDEVRDASNFILQAWIPEDCDVELEQFPFSAYFKLLENVGTWGVDIDLSCGFDYSPPGGDSVNWILVQQTPPAWDEVNWQLGSGLNFPALSLTTDYIHQAFGNLFDCGVSMQDLEVLIEPGYYTPPNGDKVNFTLVLYSPVEWDEVNWFWPVHFLGNLEKMGSELAWADLGLLTDQYIEITSLIDGAMFLSLMLQTDQYLVIDNVINELINFLGIEVQADCSIFVGNTLALASLFKAIDLGVIEFIIIHLYDTEFLIAMYPNFHHVFGYEKDFSIRLK